MPKYRPTDLAERFAKAGEPGWAALTHGLNIVSFLLGVQLHACGNPNCGSSFETRPGRRPPQFCPGCGDEIDWSAPARTTHPKVCPQCSERYHLEDKFCEQDGSSLEVREMPA
jgi:hypothetical protein